MKHFFACALLMLAACDESLSTASSSNGAMTAGGKVTEIPEGVLAITAPGQDLTDLRIDPVDGCYVYRHDGPVETTYLPLRSSTGRPICSRAPEETVAPTT